LRLDLGQHFDPFTAGRLFIDQPVAVIVDAISAGRRIVLRAIGIRPSERVVTVP
jgi:hypothetical protein